MASSQTKATSLIAAASNRQADTSSSNASTAAKGTTFAELWQEANSLGLGHHNLVWFTPNTSLPSEYGGRFIGPDGEPVTSSSANYDTVYSWAKQQYAREEKDYMNYLREKIEAKNIQNQMAATAKEQEQNEWNTNYLKRTQQAAAAAQKARGSNGGGLTGSLISSDILRTVTGG